MLTRAKPDDGALAMDQLRLRVEAGVAADDLDELPERCRRAVRVATAIGAPLLDALDGAQAAQDDVARSRRAVAVASAQTRAVAAGLLGAPLLLVPGLGRLVGADLVGFYTSGLGLLVLAVAGAMLGIGATLVVLLVRRVGRARRADRGRRGGVALAVALLAGLVTWRFVLPALAPLAALLVHHVVDRRTGEPEPHDVDEAADLAATALAGGVSAPEALRVAADELPALAPRLRRLAFGMELGMGADDLRGAGGPSSTQTPAGRTTAPPGAATVPRGRASSRVEADTSARRHERRGVGPAARRPSRPPPADGLTRLAVVLATADEVGAPVAPTLRRLARDLRADELARVLAAAERLPAQLTFPTALCLLPASVLLVGAPIVHAGIGAAGI